MEKVKNFKEYIDSFYNHLNDEYKRYSTPHYYEGDTEYVLVKPNMYEKDLVFKIDSVSPSIDGDHTINFVPINSNEANTRNIRISEVHFRMKRKDELNATQYLVRHSDGTFSFKNKKYIGKPIKLNHYTRWIKTKKGLIKISFNNFGRNYKNVRCGSISAYVGNEIHTLRITCYGDKFYYDTHIPSDYPKDRCHYEYTVRDFKKKVFGNENIKLKCSIFKEDTIVL